VITFSENVKKGTGNIVIKEGGVVKQTIDVTATSVTIVGATITIDPTDFTASAAVSVEMAAGVFKDLANNNYAGIADVTTWNFAVATIADITPPTVSTFSPLDNATAVSTASNLVIMFSENIQKGIGNILIKEAGTTTQTIPVADVTVTGSTVTINPADFTSGALVNIEMPAGVFKDLSNNNFGGITNATTWNFTAAASTPPTINNTTVTAIGAGTAVAITATITGQPPVTATVEYRSISAGGATSTQNMSANGNVFTHTISSSELGSLGIEYKITANSSGGTANTGTEFKTVKVNATSVGLSIPYISFGSSISSYRIVSVPLELTSKTVASVFDELGPYNPANWRMYRYDNGVTRELTGSTQMLPGQGFWLIIKNNPGNAINSGGGNSVNVTTAAPLEIDLKDGWNQIGNPYNFNLSWADVQAANPGLPGLRIFDGDFADGTRLDKMQGGFVRVAGAQKLKFPVVRNASVNGRTREEGQLFLNALDQPDWQVYFTLQQGNMFNRIAGFGMNEKASDGFDAYDGFSMPRFFETYLELNHSKKESGDFYSKDIVPTANQYEWDFSVATTLKENLLQFTWDNSYFGGNEKELYLWDVHQQRAINMRAVSNYSFNKNSAKSFKVFYGPQDFIKEKTAVNELVLHSVFPSPATEEITISFTLPEAAKAQSVLFTMTDMMGRKCWDFEGKFASGYHEIKWLRAKDLANAIYFLNLKSGAANKQAKVVLK